MPLQLQLTIPCLRLNDGGWRYASNILVRVIVYASSSELANEFAEHSKSATL
jgi:hypothetical protein